MNTENTSIIGTSDKSLSETNTVFNKIVTRAANENPFEFKVITDDKATQIAEGMTEMSRGLAAFCKTNTQFTALNLTLSEITPERNIRQIAAQIESKRTALAEAQTRLRKQENKLKRKKIELELISDRTYEDNRLRDIDMELVTIEIEELYSQMVDGTVHIEASIKEVGMYQQAYKEIVSHFNLDNWDEKDMEEADLVYNLKRCFNQALRSCRQTHIINEANQEWLEQLGINPQPVEAEMLAFLGAAQQTLTKELMETQTIKAGSFDEIETFLDMLVSKYKEMPLQRMKKKGLSTHYYEDWLYVEPSREELRLAIEHKQEGQ